MGLGLFSWIASSIEKAEVFKYYHTSLPNSLNKAQRRFQYVIVLGMFRLLIDLIQIVRCRRMGAGMAARRWDRIYGNRLKPAQVAAGKRTRAPAMCFVIIRDIVYVGEVGDESWFGLSGDAGCGAGRGWHRARGGWHPDRRGNL